MTKIIFPTDFSATANNAFIYALKLANSLNAELFVLHTYEMPIISTMSSGEPDVIFDVYGKLEDHQHEYYLKHTAEMKAIAEKHNLMGVKPTYLFERGLLIPIMEKIINREDVNFAVMGTTGASGIEKKLMGYSRTENPYNKCASQRSLPRNEKNCFHYFIQGEGYSGDGRNCGNSHPITI